AWWPAVKDWNPESAAVSMALNPAVQGGYLCPASGFPSGDRSPADMHNSDGAKHPVSQLSAQGLVDWRTPQGCGHYTPEPATSANRLCRCNCFTHGQSGARRPRPAAE